MSLRHAFERGAKAACRFTGQPLCFALAVGVVLAWVVSGPLFGFSDTWQLVINTGTTIVTFLMVFLIQNSQNRDAAAVQIKLDELIRATKAAEDALLDLEELDEETLEKFRQRYERLARRARAGAPCDVHPVSRPVSDTLPKNDSRPLTE
ncbi:low affinity iron permease family protein [Lysobacter sp. 1R34A]|uniref:low affinity iron permease family protein n=1 Tax=Lysobacter sp. 1R34A TaxID=3445786 RepID=UPI003EE97C37